MKKRVVIILLVILAICMGFILCMNNTTFDKKMSLLQDAYNHNIIKKDKENIVIVSICDTKTQAIVKYAKVDSVEEAYNKLKKEFSSYIKENNYDAKWVKIDIVKNIETISEQKLSNKIANTRYDYWFRNGIILNTDNREIVLTEAELNSNKIIDYDEAELVLDNLNEYLKSHGEKRIKEIPNQLKIFTTTSYFCDEKNNVYELYSTGLETGRRKKDDIEEADIKSIIESSTSFLSNMVQDNGKFVYVYYPLTGKMSKDYNILRHSGSIWSLVECYNNTSRQKEQIDKAIKYLETQIIEKDDIYYVVEEKNNEIKLGGNALSVIAICDYIDKFKNTNYIETVKKLGNGIISMQNEDGGYVHVLNADDYSLKNQYRTVFYDGEATFALSKLYSVTKDSKYLENAEKAIRYFIDNNYTKYADHWISYAVNEITNYIDSEEYYEFGLKNLADNIDKIEAKDIISHTDFEMLMQTYELYSKILEKNIDVKYINDFPINRLKQLINKKVKIQLNSYLYPEIAMYLKDPSKYCNTIYVRHNNFRIRIDDIQHTIVGYKHYLENIKDL